MYVDRMCFHGCYHNYAGSRDDILSPTILFLLLMFKILVMMGHMDLKLPQIFVI